MATGLSGLDRVTALLSVALDFVWKQTGANSHSPASGDAG
jgi:hypothetical protein